MTFDSPVAYYKPPRCTKSPKKKTAAVIHQIRAPEIVPQISHVELVKHVDLIINQVARLILDPNGPPRTFSGTRPPSTKPISSRKTSGAKTPNPCNKSSLVNLIGIQPKTPGLRFFETNLDILERQRQPETLFISLKEIGLPDAVLVILDRKCGLP